MKPTVRVRFAPSPTGMLHLGNIRAALFNYFFARQHNGVFILRVEDTDQERNVAAATEAIIQDLHWVGITVDEGPFYQSARHEQYVSALAYLIEKKLVYKCFCTKERLSALREEQRAAGKPPRYDRFCRTLPHEKTDEYHAQGTPFVWRFKVDLQEKVMVQTLERGEIPFLMSNFHDIPLTRSDQSFTFLFANFVDDMAMNITHVMRGEDHLTNTVLQVALYNAFEIPVPTFVHLPLLSNLQGKKLSKRDFGFSLQDLQQAGFLPAALTHYLLMIGGKTIEGVYTHEQLIAQIPLVERFTTHAIRYDLEALKNINHRYIQSYDAAELYDLLLHFDTPVARIVHTAEKERVIAGIAIVKAESYTLEQLLELLVPLVQAPHFERSLFIKNCNDDRETAGIILHRYELLAGQDSTDTAFITELKKWARDEQIPLKVVLTGLRYVLTGVFKGYGMADLLSALPRAVVTARIAAACTLFRG